MTWKLRMSKCWMNTISKHGERREIIMTREEATKVYHGLLNQKIKEAFEVFAPELRESEDERMIEQIKFAVMQMPSDREDTKKECLAWLEKQKENSKSADSISSNCTSDAKCENKHNEKGDFVFELRQIISSHRYSDIYGEYTNDEEGMASEILELCKCELEKQKEQKPLLPFDELTPEEKMNHPLYLEGFDVGREVQKVFDEQKPTEWSEEDELMRLAVIQTLESFGGRGTTAMQIDWLKSLKDRGIFPKSNSPSEWSEEDEYKLNFLTEMLDGLDQREFDARYMKELSSWLKSFPERFNLQPKQEWSEEGKHRCKDAIYFLETAKKHYADTSEIELTIEWLKSLQPQAKQYKQCIYGETPSVERCAVCSARCDIRVKEDKQKPEVKLTGWVARDENGEIYAYEDYPEKDSEIWIGSNSMLLDRKSFPDLKWEDEPMEVEITIRKK